MINVDTLIIDDSDYTADLCNDDAVPTGISPKIVLATLAAFAILGVSLTHRYQAAHATRK